MQINGCPLESIAKVTALKIGLLLRDLAPSGAPKLKCSRKISLLGLALICILLFGCFCSVSANVAHGNGGDFELMNKQRREAGKSKLDELMTEYTGKMDDTTYLAYTTFFTHSKHLLLREKRIMAAKNGRHYLQIIKDFTGCCSSAGGFCSKTTLGVRETKHLTGKPKEDYFK